MLKRGWIPHNKLKGFSSFALHHCSWKTFILKWSRTAFFVSLYHPRSTLHRFNVEILKSLRHNTFLHPLPYSPQTQLITTQENLDGNCEPAEWNAQDYSVSNPNSQCLPMQQWNPSPLMSVVPMPAHVTVESLTTNECSPNACPCNSGIPHH